MGMALFETLPSELTSWLTSLFFENIQMQSGAVGVLGAIAPKLVATEAAFAEKHVLHKTSRHFPPPFPVQENLNK